MFELEIWSSNSLKDKIYLLILYFNEILTLISLKDKIYLLVLYFNEILTLISMINLTFLCAMSLTEKQLERTSNHGTSM